MGQVGAKMALSCPTWRQDGTKMAILERKMANLSPFWEPSWIIFAILGAIFAILGAKSEIAKNIKKKQFFLSFLGSWACSWTLFWLILALCWAMLGHHHAILEQLGDKMPPESAKMIQDSAQERQDEAR